MDGRPPDPERDPLETDASAPPPDGPAEPARREAPQAAAHWLSAARRALDAEFGPGYAAANPALTAAFLQACALDAAVQAGRASTDQALTEVGRLGRETNATLLKLRPRLFG